MNLTWRTRRLINNATAEDIHKLLALDCWQGEALERLAQRVEEAAHDDPPNGYPLALQCLLFLAGRIDDDDLQARALTAAGAAARRLGRAGEAGQLYEKAKRYARTPRTRARLYLCIAVLAREEGRYDTALEILETISRLNTDLADIRNIRTIVKGTILLKRGHELASQSDLDGAIGCFVRGATDSDPGSQNQIWALINLIVAMEEARLAVQQQQIWPILTLIRNAARDHRTKGIQRAIAYADWIEGRLAFELGSTRKGIRQMRKAGRLFARLGFHADALSVAIDLLERGVRHGAAEEAYGSGADVAILIPKDSPQGPALELYKSFEFGLDNEDWFDGVRTAIKAARTSSSA